MGLGFTVKTTVLIHPLELVYVIVVVPGPTPVTSPVELTVATAELEEVHGLVVDGVPLPVNCELFVPHILSVPLIVGRARTLKPMVTEHPAELV